MTINDVCRVVLDQWDAYDETGPVPMDDLMESIREAMPVDDTEVSVAAGELLALWDEGDDGEDTEKAIEAVRVALAVEAD